MKVTVKLFATLREIAGKEVVLELSDEATPQTALQHLNIPEKEAAILMINGRGARLSTPLKDSDVLAVFPLVGGG